MSIYSIFVSLREKKLLFFSETVCPTRIPVASRDEKGFDILVGLDIRKKALRIEGSYLGKRGYRVTAEDDLTEKTRY